jgi:acyl-CoA synthetase (NDP forming)
LLGNDPTGAEEIVSALVTAHAATAKPFVVSWTGGTGGPRDALLTAGVPTYTDPHRGVRALGRVAERSLRIAVEPAMG